MLCQEMKLAGTTVKFYYDSKNEDESRKNIEYFENMLSIMFCKAIQTTNM